MRGTIKTGVALGAVVTLALVGARPSQAQFGNLILNGGFESTAITGNFVTRNAGNTSLTSWTIGGNSIDQIRGYWTPNSGAQSIDLSGSNAGIISQTVFLQANPNWTYALDFWMAGNPQGGSTTKSLGVFFNDGTNDVFSDVATFSTVGKSRTNMGWELRHFEFTPATSGFYTLRFASNNAGNFGPAMDDVTLQVIIPEPGSIGLMAAGLLPMGLLLRRRRK